MRQVQHQLAGSTGAASLTVPGSCFTQDRLGQPQCQPLLPNAGGSLEEEGLGQSASRKSACQPVSNPLVAVKGGYWHSVQM